MDGDFLCLPDELNKPVKGGGERIDHCLLDMELSVEKRIYFICQKEGSNVQNSKTNEDLTIPYILTNVDAYGWATE
eukprot:15351734-Ditylum_brightwellii.AAC.1